MSKKALYFTLGTLFGTASGIIAGMLLAPRSGAESRAMAADAMKSGNIPANPRQSTLKDLIALYEKAL